MAPTVFVREFPYREITGLEQRSSDELRRDLDAILDQVNPIGGLKPWAAQATVGIPPGWLLCDGQAVNRQQYQSLFAIIGTTYGVGDGVATFNVPDMQGRTVFGQDVLQVEFDTIGETGGSKTMTTAAMPVHDHTGSTGGANHNHEHGVSTGGAAGHAHVTDGSGAGQFASIPDTSPAFNNTVTSGQSFDHGHAVIAEGSGTAGGNLPPYVVMRWIIKA